MNDLSGCQIYAKMLKMQNRIAKHMLWVRVERVKYIFRKLIPYNEAANFIKRNATGMPGFNRLSEKQAGARISTSKWEVQASGKSVFGCTQRC